jgi:hypothetical protein
LGIRTCRWDFCVRVRTRGQRQAQLVQRSRRDGTPLERVSVNPSWLADFRLVRITDSSRTPRHVRNVRVATPFDQRAGVRPVLTFTSARVGKGGSNCDATAGEGAAQKYARVYRFGSNLKREPQPKPHELHLNPLRLFTGIERLGVRVSDIERSYRNCRGLLAGHNARHSSRTPTE